MNEDVLAADTLTIGMHADVLVHRAAAENETVQSRRQRVLTMRSFFDEGHTVHFVIELAPKDGVYQVPPGTWDMTGLPPWTVQSVTLPISFRLDTRVRRSRVVRRLVRLARRGQIAEALERLRAYVQRRNAAP